MDEVGKMVAALTKTIEQQFPEVPLFRPGKISMWIKFFRFVPMDGCRVEQSIGNVEKHILTVTSVLDLIQTVAENIVLAVYGREMPIVPDMPNLAIKLFDRKVYFHPPGAPPLDQEDQIFLKVTVYNFEPSLWDRLFKRTLQEEATTLDDDTTDDSQET